MKFPIKAPLLAALSFAVFIGTGNLLADQLDDAIRQTALDYTQRLDKATKELNATREKIANEETPLLNTSTKLQGDIIVLEQVMKQVESNQAQANETLVRTQRDLDSLKRNLNYVSGQSFEALKGLSESLLPGEALLMGEQLKVLHDNFEDPTHPVEAMTALDAVELALNRMTRALGGYTAQGSSLSGNDSRVLQGSFVFLGPEVFFRSDAGDVFGSARSRAGGGLYPVTHAMPGWKKEQAAALFSGQLAKVPVDASGGKALNLRQTKGSLLKHIDTGGAVAYIIILVGFVALIIIVMKLVDIKNLRVDETARVRAFLTLVTAGKEAESRQALTAISASTREVFSTGLQHLGKPKAAMEDHLLAHIQQQRLHFERRLPLLTVIATASPLLGLLGTVMGMVKTFALITVFGTGNAAKLSSGISEVLVATELGLAVAIPTLVAHGFLAHRIQKDLAILEKQAFEFVAATEEARGLTRKAVVA